MFHNFPLFHHKVSPKSLSNIIHLCNFYSAQGVVLAERLHVLVVSMLDLHASLEVLIQQEYLIVVAVTVTVIIEASER